MRALIFLFAFLVLSGSVSAEEINANGQEYLKSLLGKTITVEGTAENLKLGAMVAGDECSIWIEGLERWPSDVVDKPVKATGIVIEKYDMPIFHYEELEFPVQEIPIMEGDDENIASHRYLLKQAEWNATK